MMGRLVFCLAMLFLFSPLFAQQKCNQTPRNKKLDLRSELYPDVSVVTRSYKTTDPTIAVGGDVSYLFDLCETFGNNCDYSGSALLYDVYYPTSFDYGSCSLPAIFLFHGGGYSDCSGYGDGQMRTLATEFAKRGFVAFNVEYRRGVLLSPDTGYYTAQQMLAMYRADQDARGAIRSAIRRQRERSVFNEPYSIDTANLFIGGRSAGSATALNVAYYQTQSMVDKVMPGIKQALGSINAGFYLGDTTTKIKIRGVLNLWGGAPVANEDASDYGAFFRQNANLPPMIAFCGEKDPTFNYMQQPIKYVAPNAVYPLIRTSLASESRCVADGVTFTLNSLYPDANGVMLGGQGMYTMLRNLNKSSEVYLDSTMKHGLDDGSTGYDGFGLGTSNTDTILTYIAQRGASFFQSVMNNLASKFKRSRFENCRNDRFANNKADNNSCSPAAPVGPKSNSSKTAASARQPVSAPAAGFVITPNPVRDILHIQWLHALPAAVLLQITDASGRVWQQQKIAPAGSGTLSVPVSKLAGGIYYVKMITAKRTEVKKWVKL